MGLTHVQVTVRNPADLSRNWEGRFLVDTGAIDCLIPRERLEQIGLRPRGRRTYELADGRQVDMDIAVAQLEFMEEIVGATILFGEEGTEPLLGVTALESLGIEVDPTNQRLRKLPSIRLKSVDGPPAWLRPAVAPPAPNSREQSRPRGSEPHVAGAARPPGRSPSAAPARRTSSSLPKAPGESFASAGKASSPFGALPEGAEEGAP